MLNHYQIKDANRRLQLLTEVYPQTIQWFQTHHNINNVYYDADEIDLTWYKTIAINPMFLDTGELDPKTKRITDLGTITGVDHTLIEFNSIPLLEFTIKYDHPLYSNHLATRFCWRYEWTTLGANLGSAFLAALEVSRLENKLKLSPI